MVEYYWGNVSTQLLDHRGKCHVTMPFEDVYESFAHKKTLFSCIGSVKYDSSISCIIKFLLESLLTQGAALVPSF